MGSFWSRSGLDDPGDSHRSLLEPLNSSSQRDVAQAPPPTSSTQFPAACVDFCPRSLFCLDSVCITIPSLPATTRGVNNSHRTNSFSFPSFPSFFSSFSPPTFFSSFSPPFSVSSYTRAPFAVAPPHCPPDELGRVPATQKHEAAHTQPGLDERRHDQSAGEGHDDVDRLLFAHDGTHVGERRVVATQHVDEVPLDAQPRRALHLWNSEE